MKVKALCLMSGGLDSALAAKVVAEQGIEVIGVCFYNVFNGKPELTERVCKSVGIPLKTVKLGADYIKMLRKPKYGYGAGINPCIDCKIFFLKKAAAMMKEMGAKFIVTGEVLNERPMSQTMKSLRIVEQDSGLRGQILRPLSAKLLPPTDPETKGLVDRAKLLDLQGRQRKRQIELAKRYGISGYENPAGGCRLTNKEFAMKLEDFFSHNKGYDEKEMEILKYGRHFRFGNNKIIVGRNEADNEALMKLKRPSDLVFEVLDCGSPVTILKGEKTDPAIRTAASLTAFYSDAKGEEVKVSYGKKMEKEIMVGKIAKGEVERMRVC